MSKVFNTLEQIRKNEQDQVPDTSDNTGSKKGSSKRLTTVIASCLAVTVLILIVFTVIPYLKQPAQDQHDNTAASAPQDLPQQNLKDPSTDAKHKKTADQKAQPSRVFNQSLRLGSTAVQKQNYWKGIYLLEKAARENPNSVEPIINLGVALSELGLHGPAARFFSQASGIAPDNPKLRKNLTILADAGLLDMYREISGDRLLGSIGGGL
ncbi:hypothetical protein ACFL6N_06410 [Thermodesulfobacteriota bacterium]